MTQELTQILQQVDMHDEKAIYYLLRAFANNMLSPDEKASIHLYLKANTKKSHSIIYLRALLFEHGFGVSKDLETAFLLMREAASRGNANAIYEVGRYFLHGIGVERNDKNAFEWLKMAVESPYYVPKAMHELALMYENGLAVVADKEKAKHWHAKAIAGGYTEE